MKTIQVKDVPDALHRKLRQRAERQGRTIRDLVLEAVRREIAREEFEARLRTRSRVHLGRSAASALEESRDARDGDLHR
jgi:antitoxin FitA